MYTLNTCIYCIHKQVLNPLMYMQGIHLSMVYCMPICESLLRVCDKEGTNSINMLAKSKNWCKHDGFLCMGGTNIYSL
jgi:hypothetical protein